MKLFLTGLLMFMLVAFTPSVGYSSCAPEDTKAEIDIGYESVAVLSYELEKLEYVNTLSSVSINMLELVSCSNDFALDNIASNSIRYFIGTKSWFPIEYQRSTKLLRTVKNDNKFTFVEYHYAYGLSHCKG